MARSGCFRVLSIILVLLLAFAGWAAWYLFVPYQAYANETFVELEYGTSAQNLAATLEKAGVVRNRYSFLFWRALHPKAALQAGEYRFDRPLTPAEVFDKIHRGAIYYEVLAVPEGSNLFDIAQSLGGLRYIKPADFIAAASDPSLVRDLDPAAPSLEGYLFPSSYRITRKTTAKDLCRAMVDQFQREWRRISAGLDNPDVHRIVTLASLVEKETAVPAERPLIASVFQNRLRRNMALQCDPTVVYAALRENKYRGAIYRSDLASNDPYNTYEHLGLPPGPIANPGAVSLTGALHPAETDYLYFVAKPGSVGQHTFSATLTEHQMAVKAYRGGR